MSAVRMCFDTVSSQIGFTHAQGNDLEDENDEKSRHADRELELAHTYMCDFEYGRGCHLKQQRG